MNYLGSSGQSLWILMNMLGLTCSEVSMRIPQKPGSARVNHCSNMQNLAGLRGQQQEVFTEGSLGGEECHARVLKPHRSHAVSVVSLYNYC